MNVVHVMPTLERSFGGPVEALFGYVAAGTSAGIRTTVIAPRTRETDWDWVQSEMPTAHVVAVGHLGIARQWAGPAVARAVRALAAAGTVVHVHGTLDLVSSAGSYAALAKGCPLVIGPFGTLSRYTFSHRRARAKRWYFDIIDAPVLRRGVVHFTSDFERDCAAWHGVDFAADGRSFVVPPPVRSLERPHRASVQPSVLFLGRLHPVKRVELLLDAWPLVRERNPDARLVIAGTGLPAYVAALEGRAGGPDSGVTFTGFLADPLRALRLAETTVCVLPSWHESFGVAVLEALGAGVPVVVTPSVALAPFVERQGFGVVAAPSVAGLAGAITSVIGDAALRSATEARGPAAVRQEFAPTAVAPALVRMYESAARRMRAA